MRIALLLTLPLAALAQSTPTFEVASIRLNQSGARGGSMQFSPGGERFIVTNLPFGALVLAAYDITVRQLSGGGPFLSEKYDVEAKADHPVRRAEMLRMLQALLADRFKLSVHHETREVAVYALTVGKGGPRMRRSEVKESEGAILRTPSSAGGSELGTGHLVFKNESMGDLAWALTRMAGIGDFVVVDQTGLPGAYDFELKFERDNPSADGQPAQRQEPSIFAALQEQLGLKLVLKKAPVEFVVIDHVERSSEN